MENVLQTMLKRITELEERHKSLEMKKDELEMRMGGDAQEREDT